MSTKDNAGDMPDSNVDDASPRYTVGYKKPPVATRFRPGISGNPVGRARGSQNFQTLTLKALNRRVWVTINGKQRHVTRPELALEHAMTRAAKGDPRAFSIMLALIERFLPPPEPDTSSQAATEKDEDLVRQLAEIVASSSGNEISTAEESDDGT